jgi:predicted lipoprotein with Yx(FWY)xxD motif
MNRTGARRIAAMVVIPLALAACGSSSKKAATSPTTASAGSSATTAASGGYGGATATTTAATATTTAAGSTSGATVQVATVGKLGKVLVTADGHTLYLFEKDTGTTSACTGQCMGAWPPYTSMNAPTAGTGVTAAKLTTATGAAPHQVVYNGHLLYEFSGDKKAGDANGKGIPSWYPVTPQGTSSE